MSLSLKTKSIVIKKGGPFLLGFIFLTCLLILSGIIFSLITLNRNIEITQIDNLQLSLKLQEVEDIIKALVVGNNDLAVALEQEQSKRLEAEEEYEKSVEQLSTLEVSVAGYRQTLDSQDIVKLINNWSPQVARINCQLKSGDREASSKASGVATIESGQTRFITNKHVVIKDDLQATKCEITFATSSVKLETTSFNLDTETDLAFVDMNRYVNLPGVSGSVKTCVKPPVIGDGVVILGYPSVGSNISITATEGIISGLDDDYYITSAKIEQGNSGGAAISVKDNCLLGLPTLVVAGRIESLARILPIK